MEKIAQKKTILRGWVRWIYTCMGEVRNEYAVLARNKVITWEAEAWTGSLY
jgi:hypothetical protein